MFLKFTCNGLMVSKYEISGNLLFLPIEGKGPFRAKMRGVEVHLNLNFGEEVGSDGKAHWKVSYKNYKIYTRDKCELEFDNLFDGNAILAAAAKEMISQNGNEIVKEIGLPIIKTIIDIIIDNMNDLFKVIPADDLYIN